MNTALLINLAYIVAAVLFVFGLKRLGSPATARSGNGLSAIGMLIAIVATLFEQVKLPWENIIGGIVVGSLIGGIAARKVEMTGMPELVAIFNGFGGAASLLVGWAALYPALGLTDVATISSFTATTIVLSILIGGVTLTGSIIAYGKLSEKMTTSAINFSGQQIVNVLIVLGILASAIMLVNDPSPTSVWFWAVLGLSLVFGIMVVIPIGGADMPVVIALLNSYSGLAACAAGFVLNNNLLIVSGSLVGASGIILTNIMCKAMNRSLANVLFSGFSASKSSATVVEGEPKPISAEDAYLIVEAAQRVVIVPGYGMAVAQAQHVVKELCDKLENNGCDVKFAIHPVAGRMPNVVEMIFRIHMMLYQRLLVIV
jgi:NAD(P) transhydrogenase subunit beta